jgi:hypothetical protein
MYEDISSVRTLPGSAERVSANGIYKRFKCRIPDDWIDNKRHPLFMARKVLRTLIEPLQP